MAAIGEEGRKGRFLGLNATTFQPPLPPSSHDVSFDPICKKETFVPKRFSGSPSASLFLFSRTYRGASAPPPSLLPFASSAPFGVFSPSVLLFITRLFRKRKRPPRGHHRNVLLSLTQQYLRHGSKLESISKKFISNAGIFSSFFLVLSFFLSISLSARFYLVSSCLQMHANGKRKNGEGRGLLYRANIFTNSRRAWPLLCRLWRRDYWLSIIWK